jgi:hypothetical protein
MQASAVSQQPSALTGIPERAHYDAKYLGTNFVRLASYRVQLALAMRTDPRSVLVVGKGDGIVQDLLERTGMQIATLDIQPDLKPTYVGSVDAIPLPEESYDVVLCCQVLEHMPFDRFVTALRELGRVAKSRVIVSLPDIRRFVSLRISAPKLKIDWQVNLPQVRAPRISQERLEVHGHYWEIGFHGTSFKDVLKGFVEARLNVLQTRRVSDLPWHTFIYAARADTRS